MVNDILSKLERLANAATPGPWFTVESPWLPPGVPTYVIAGSADPHAGRLVCDFDFIEDRDQTDNSDADAAFIAAADPGIVKALIAEIRRLRMSLDNQAKEADEEVARLEARLNRRPFDK